MTNIPEEIQKKHSENEELLDSLDSYIEDNFRLVTNRGNKKSLAEIRQYFKINIPEDVNFMTLVTLATEISDKYQKATYLRDKQKVKLVLLEQTRQDKYNSAYNDAREEIRRETGKPLAAESCRVAAILKTKQLEESVNTQQVIYNFWDGICKTLTEMRKLCEVISIALSGDAKIQRDFIVKGN